MFNKQPILLIKVLLFLGKYFSLWEFYLFKTTSQYLTYLSKIYLWKTLSNSEISNVSKIKGNQVTPSYFLKVCKRLFPFPGMSTF